LGGQKTFGSRIGVCPHLEGRWNKGLKKMLAERESFWGCLGKLEKLRAGNKGQVLRRNGGGTFQSKTRKV